MTQNKSTWTFFTNHTHVLICLAMDANQPLREVASKVGITERAVQRIVSELEADGYLTKEKVGRQNIYKLDLTQKLRHEIESNYTIGDVLDLFLNDSKIEEKKSA